MQFRFSRLGVSAALAADTDLELYDLTLRYGNSDDDGGGLSSNSGDLLVERVDFIANDAQSLGAGLAAGGDGAVVVLNDVRFGNNGSASTFRGGGASLGRSFSASDVTLVDVVFSDNAAGGGGGLYLFNSQASSGVACFAALRNTTFSGNEANGDGGGIYTAFDTPYELINVLFKGNFAGSSGGGIF